MQWDAYKAAVRAAAGYRGELSPADPRAAVPEALRPGAHRVHRAYVGIGGLRAVVIMAVALTASSFGSITGSLSHGDAPAWAAPVVFAAVAAFILLLAGIIFLTQWLSWKHLSYELTADELNVYSGVLSKKRVHVPYQRVQAVNQQAGVLQRVFGLCDVKIDTAGGSSNEAVKLSYVRNSDAEALRSELFRRKKVLLAGGAIDEYGDAFVGGVVVPSAWMLACSGGDTATAQAVLADAPTPPAASAPTCAASPAAAPIPSPVAAGAVAQASPAEGNVLDAADELLGDIRGVFGGAEVSTGRVSYECRLSNKELVLAGLSGSAGMFGVMLAGVLGVVGSASALFQSSIEDWVEASIEGAVSSGATVDQGIDALSSALASAALGVVIWAASFVAIMWLLSVGATIVQYGGFVARRREARIEVEHGLLKRTFHGVDVDRVQAVVIKQSFVRRLIGYCELSLQKIDAVSSDGADQGAAMQSGVVIHPFVKLDRVPEILAGIVPEYADMPEAAVNPAPVALRRAVVRKGLVRNPFMWAALLVAAAYAACEAAGALGAGIGIEALDAVRIAAAVFAALFALSFAVEAVDAVLWHRRSGLGYDRAFLRITNGGLAVRTVVLPRKKIQFAFTKTNPFQRMAHVKIVAARTAAGVSGATEQLWDIPDAQADAWMDWARPRPAAAKRRAFVLSDEGSGAPRGLC